MLISVGWARKLLIAILFLAGLGSLNSYSVLGCPTCGGMGPVVTGISAPSEMEVGKSYTVTLTYHDDHGDAVSAIITNNGFPISALPVPDGTDGSVSTMFTCTQAGQSLLFSGSVSDSMNVTSASSQFARSTCVAPIGAPTPPVEPPLTPSATNPQLLLAGVVGGVTVNGATAQNGSPVYSGDTISMPTGNSQVQLDVKCGKAAAMVAFGVAVSAQMANQGRLSKVYLTLIFDVIFETLIQACYVASASSLQGAASSTSLAFSINLKQGAIKLQGQYDGLSLKMTTPHSSVSSSGRNTFSVGYNPTTGETLVEANSGDVDVQPGGSGQRMVTLHSGQQVIIDQSGNAGQTTSIGQTPSTTPSPTTGGSSLKSFDKNKNNVLDNDEFFAVVDAWIANQIDNPTFFKAVDLWISQGKITAASFHQETVQLLMTRTSLPTEQLVTFQMKGGQVNNLDVAVYDLAGHHIFSENASGSTLNWNMDSEDGRSVPDGVYLCEVTALGEHGQILMSEIKKLVVER